MYHPQQQMMLNSIQLGQQQLSMMNALHAPIGAPEVKLQNIDHPGKNDVMCGRGGGTNNHTGNIRFRQLVNGHKLRYLAATKSEKPMVSREVVTIWRNLNPPGRFLKQQPADGDKPGLWSDVGDKKAREKASQCLRERTPDVAEFMKKLELQMTLQEQEQEAKKSNGNVSPNRGNGNQITAAQVSEELLQQQQQATLKAHLALEAFIPVSVANTHNHNPTLPPDHNLNIMNMMNMPNNKIGIFQNNIPLQQQPTTNTLISPNAASTNNALDQQRERLALEIAQLQQQQAQLEAMARQSRHPGKPQVQGQVINSPITHEPTKNKGTSLPTAADLLNDLELLNNVDQSFRSINKDDAHLSRDQYRKSVLEFMGSGKSGKSSKSSKSGKSSKSLKSNSSVHSANSSEKTAPAGKANQKSSRNKSDKKINNSDRDTFNDVLLPNADSYERESEFETRSQNSWINKLSFDDVSMSSALLLQNEDLMPRPLSESHNSIDTVQTSNAKNTRNETSLTSYEHSILDSMINPTNIGQGNTSQSNQGLPNIYEDNKKTRAEMSPQISPIKPRLSSQRAGSMKSYMSMKSNISMLSSGSARPTMQDHKEVSNVSMLSDFSEKSNKDTISWSRYSKFAKAKSDHSMGISDNVSDLSEALGSLEMK